MAWARLPGLLWVLLTIPIFYLAPSKCKNNQICTLFINYFFLFRYPEAKIVGVTATQEKLKAINVLPRNLDKIDFNVQIQEEYDALNKEMREDNISFHHTAGDVGTQCINMLVNKVLLTVDLIYGSHDGNGAFGMTLQEMLALEDEQYFLRLMRYIQSMFKEAEQSG